MRREALSKAFIEAATAFGQAYLDFAASPTPANRRKMDEATHDYMARLTPLFGSQAAFPFAVAYQQFLEALDRLERLHPPYERSLFEESDVTFLYRLQAEMEAARKVFEDVLLKTSAMVDEIAERDESEGV